MKISRECHMPGECCEGLNAGSTYCWPKIASQRVLRGKPRCCEAQPT